ncbi:hypothetical protein LMG24076_01932 [Trinickia soli]|nr:hypothetical protein LMG24076_01932 [Trinickia soli]
MLYALPNESHPCSTSTLEPGEFMRFVNDRHGCRVMQIGHDFGPRVDIGYVAREPGNIVVDAKTLEATSG